MNLTTQQLRAIDTIKKDDTELICMSAIAGSGKTATLIEMASALDPSNGLYLAYNKAIAS